MKKKSIKPTMQICLIQEEQQLHVQAEQIIVAKKVGVHQCSIDKMVLWFIDVKRHYDDMKRRYDKYGK